MHFFLVNTKKRRTVKERLTVIFRSFLTFRRNVPLGRNRDISINVASCRDASLTAHHALRYFVPRGTAALRAMPLRCAARVCLRTRPPRVAALRALPGVMQIVSLRETAAKHPHLSTDMACLTAHRTCHLPARAHPET
jgi:hypothetical protein